MSNIKVDLIKEFGLPFKKDYHRVLKQIEKFDRIAIFRHIMPDYDALGSQLGLATWIKENFPEKEVICLGDNHVTFTPRIFPEMDRVDEEWFKRPFLAIIVDTANKSRTADPRAFKTKHRIRIDHHPSEELFTKISLVNPRAAAAAELIVNMLRHFKGNFYFSEAAARYFYIALVGDSGRFLYNSTTSHTLRIAETLIETGIRIVDIYHEMYQKEMDDLKVTGYILNNFKVSPRGVAYYVLSEEVQNELNITVERGKENVNLFSNIRGVGIWCSVSEDRKSEVWRISIRSGTHTINHIAQKWGGGGHANAAGAFIKDLGELDEFIADLDAIL